jgi:hypothetical protein
MIEHHATQMARQFEAEHGPDFEQDDGWIFYPDGARRELNPLGAYMQPPAGEVERCELVVYFHELRVARLVAEFDAAKVRAKAAVGGDHEGNLRGLEKKRRMLRHRRRQLEAAREAYRFARTGRTREEEAKLAEQEAYWEAERHRRLAQLDGVVA